MNLVETTRQCAWCRGRIPTTKRADAKTCSKRCRQALHRFRVGAAGNDDTCPLHFAYADPPYPGCAQKYYGMPEVDHAELINRLTCSYDGWALSTSAEACRNVWNLCPAGTRLCIWVKGSRKGVALRSRNAWEALLVFGGRLRRIETDETLDDVLIWGGRQHSHPGALIGMKPAAFCEWMFRQLGSMRQDRLTDLYPGSGVVGRAWEMFTSDNDDTTLPSRLAEAQTHLVSRLNASMAAAGDVSRVDHMVNLK